MEITNLSIREIKNGFEKKEFSAKQVTESFLDKIDKEAAAELSTISESSRYGNDSAKGLAASIKQQQEEKQEQQQKYKR